MLKANNSKVRQTIGDKAGAVQPVRKLSGRVGPRGEEPIPPLGSKSASQSFSGLAFLTQLLARQFRMVKFRVSA